MQALINNKSDKQLTLVNFSLVTFFVSKIDSVALLLSKASLVPNLLHKSTVPSILAMYYIVNIFSKIFILFQFQEFNMYEFINKCILILHLLLLNIKTLILLFIVKLLCTLFYDNKVHMSRPGIITTL